jgi:hypothetical protein
VSLSKARDDRASGLIERKHQNPTFKFQGRFKYRGGKNSGKKMRGKKMGPEEAGEDAT